MENLGNSSLVSIIIGVLVVAFTCYRQLQTRAIREDRGVLIFVILIVLGLYEGFSFLEKHPVSGGALAITGASLVIGLAFGALRGRLVHLWRRDGKLLRRGGVITIVIWIVGLGIHLGTELLSGKLDSSAQGLATNTLLIYIALSLGAQRFVLLRRAKTIEEHPSEAPTRY